MEKAFKHPLIVSTSIQDQVSIVKLSLAFLFLLMIDSASNGLSLSITTVAEFERYNPSVRMTDDALDETGM